MIRLFSSCQLVQFNLTMNLANLIENQQTIQKETNFGLFNDVTVLFLFYVCKTDHGQEQRQQLYHTMKQPQTPQQQQLQHILPQPLQQPVSSSPNQYTIHQAIYHYPQPQPQPQQQLQHQQQQPTTLYAQHPPQQYQPAPPLTISAVGGVGSNAFIPAMIQPKQTTDPPATQQEAMGGVITVTTTTFYADGRECQTQHLEHSKTSDRAGVAAGQTEEGSERRFTCGVCGKVFHQNGTARTHMRLHTGHKPYKCDICGKGFNQSGNLRNHRRVHTGEKPYKCKYCGKGFSQVGNRQHHQRTHTGEKPYKCKECGRGFNQSSDLQKHYRTHTGEKPYKCSVCQKAFNSSSNLQRHLRTHVAFQM